MGWISLGTRSSFHPLKLSGPHCVEQAVGGSTDCVVNAQSIEAYKLLECLSFVDSLDDYNAKVLQMLCSFARSMLQSTLWYWDVSLALNFISKILRGSK